MREIREEGLCVWVLRQGVDQLGIPSAHNVALAPVQVINGRDNRIGTRPGPAFFVGRRGLVKIIVAVDAPEDGLTHSDHLLLHIREAGLLVAAYQTGQYVEAAVVV